MQVKDLSATERTALRPYFEANRRVMVEWDSIPVTTLNTFLGIAIWGYQRSSADPLSILELSQKVGLPYTTVSRHLRLLGDGERAGLSRTGPKLVETAVYPLNRRMKIAYLTARGKALADQLDFILSRGDKLRADIPAD